MQYELWHDDGDNRYAVRHPMKYMWFEAEPISLEYELTWWRDVEWDESEADQYSDLQGSKVGTLHCLGYFDSMTDLYQQYRMEYLLNA